MKQLITIVMILGASLAALGVALAGPSAQGDSLLPTPTPFPVEDVEYTLTVVGGSEEVITVPGVTANGITIGDVEAVSQYPRGVVFTTSIETENDVAIESAVVFLRFEANSGTRTAVEYNSETDEWVGHIWAGGEGRPPWTHFTFFVRVTDAEGNIAETEPVEMDYSDPTREWYRVETPHIIMYWFGTEEMTPDEVAAGITEAMAATEPRRIAGFGQPLSYKPRGVLFPTREAMAEMYGSGATNSNAAGFTSSDLGMTVQGFDMPTEDWFERQASCIYLRGPEDRPETVRVRGSIYGTIPHEVTHLYQFENAVSGPLWWTEGQAEWFTYAPGQYDFRLTELAKLDPELLPLAEPNAIGSNAFEADGCYALAYDVGPSFINWLLTNYGGIDTHFEIVQNLRAGMTVYEAIEAATGETFFDLENEWRSYTGFNTLSPADLDPALLLEAAPDAPYQPSDSVVIPGPRPVTLKEEPGGLIGQAQCFGGTMVAILRVGSLDGVDWYEVDCNGLRGWLTIDDLE